MSALRGEAITARARAKHKLYNAHVTEARARLVPFVCDVYGRMGGEAMDFVRRVMAPRAAATDRQRSTTAYISYVLSRLSVAIQVGNARAANSALQKLRSAAPRSAGARVRP